MRNILQIQVVLTAVLSAGILFGCGIPGDGNIIFVSNRDNDSEIFLTSRDGSVLFQLTDNTVEDRAPSATRDGKQFLYLSKVGEGGTFEIMTGYFYDTETHIQLTSDFFNETHASWSPDGNKICFSREVNNASDIWIMDANGENQKPITSNPGNDTQPEWSPDSEWIACISDSPFEEGEPPQVFIMKPDGSERKQLTFSEGVKSSPCWKEDGSAVYYLEEIPEHERPVKLMMSDREGNIEEIASFHEKMDHPFISPDGKMFVYSITGKGTRTELYLFDVIAGQEIRLTDNAFKDHSPRWVR